MPVKKEKKYSIGLVLSGGGARGFAHIGVMKALNESGIFPDVVAGTSAGAMAGALYADGHSPDEVMKIFSETKFFKYVEFSIPRQNLLRMTKLTKIIAENLRAKKFEELKIPFWVAATNLNHGKSEYFSKGELLKPIIASATIPVLFPPMRIDGSVYVDGGVLNNLPVEPIEKKCECIIGVNVNPTGYQEEFRGLLSIAERSFHLCFAATLPRKIKKFDIYLEPEGLEKYRLLDIAKNREIFQLGYEAGRKIISQHKELLNKYKK